MVVVLALWPLQDISSNNAGKPFIIPELPNTLDIGRKVTCELVIPEEFGYVSGKHCCVRRLPGDDADKACLLEDLSANGTYVNSTKVGKDKSAKISLGDVISLAKPTRPGGALKFKLQEAPTVAAPNEVEAAAATAIQKPSELALEPVLGVGLGDRVHSAEKVPVVSKSSTATAPANAVLPSVPMVGVADLAPMQALRQPSASSRAAIDSIANARCPPQPSALAEALNAESRRGYDMAAILQARLAETEAHCAELNAELSEEHARNLAAKAAANAEAGFLHEERCSEESSTAALSRRLASDCSELKDQLAKKQAETARFERELLPAAEEAVRLEKLQALRLQEELGAERSCMERAEKQAQQLRSECAEAEARAHSSSLQLELDNAEMRNAHLEEECAEIWKDIHRARASVANSTEKLQTRAHLLTTLKGAVKEHTQLLMDRVHDLSSALLEIPGSSSVVEDSQASGYRSRSPSRPGASRTRAIGATEIVEGHLLPPDNPEDPTLAYPESGIGLREQRGLVGCGQHTVDDNDAALVKRRRLPAEVDFPAANAPCAPAQADRQQSTSPSPTASGGESTTKAVARATTISSKLG
mmetsp:Transcript_96406/g.152475  ORF Transcript_96406/g.152475 Transcript_96406/m.152475 type:complete len:591 (+) Transcript_96406:83-1855(+)